MEKLEQRGKEPVALGAPRVELPAVADHHIHVFYVSRGQFEDEPSVTFRQLAAAQAGGASAWMPDDQLPAVAGRYAEERIWMPVRPSAEEKTTTKDKATADDKMAGGDLFPHIERLVTGRPKADAKRWVLSERALRLLSDADLYEESAPRETRTAKDLELVFVKRAQTRMAAAREGAVAEALRLRIRAMTLFRFRTGVMIADVEVQMERTDRQPLAPVELVEAVASLSRFNALQWRPRPKKTNEAPKEDAQRENQPATFSLGEVLAALVPGTGVAARSGARLFTYAFVRFDGPPPPAAARRLAVQLAQHYTDDYALVDEPGRVSVVQDFENVQHVCALEGAATIVFGGAAIATGTTPEFITRFYDQTFKRNYLPIALLNLHERAELIDITVNAAFWPNTSEIDDETLRRLERVRDRSLKLRLCYRFCEVSHITMHNAVHGAFRQVFGLDPMLRDLSQDVVEVDGFLRGRAAARAATAAEASARRWRWASVIGTAALAGLTAFTIIKEFVHIVFHHDVAAGWVGIIAGVACFLASAVIGWRSGHFTRHAEIKNVLHEAGH